MSKLAHLSLFSALFFSLVSPTVAEQKACPGKIYSAKRDGVQIYKSPNTEAPVLDILSIGEEVCYLGEDFSSEETSFAVVVFDGGKEPSSDVAYVRLSLVKAAPSSKTKAVLDSGSSHSVDSATYSTTDGKKGSGSTSKRKPPSPPPVVGLFNRAKGIVNSWRHGLPPDRILGPFEPAPKLPKQPGLEQGELKQVETVPETNAVPQ